MKSFIILLVLALVVLSLAKSQSRGCRFVSGKCVHECEAGTQAIVTDCGLMVPEATCDDPKPSFKRTDTTCENSACYCDPPTVRDTESGKCVAQEQCFKNKHSTQTTSTTSN